MSELAAQGPERANLLQTADSGDTATLLSRESQVILGGLASGAASGLSKSMSRLEAFGQNFRKAPGQTLLDFVEEHWAEAGVAAALSILVPQKAANTLIGIWSLKGVGAASWDAAKMAADPATPISRAKEIYSSEIAEQSAQMLSSLPMTLVGASAGRLSANTVFGKGLAAADLLGKRLSVSDIRSNLLNTYEQIRPPAIKLVVTDMDDTLLSTQKQQALGLQQAAGELSKKTGIAEPELYGSLGKVMEHYHSYSYPWTLELALKDRLKLQEPNGMPIETFNKEIAEPFWQTMDRSMQHLSLYPGVRQALDELARRKIPVVVLSDASASSGLRRFRHLELDQAPIERLFTLKNPAEPQELPEALRLAGRDRLSGALATEHSLKDFQVMPRQWEKPAPGGMQAIMDLYHLRPQEVLMIGDSLRRDMGVAERTGVKGLYARYKQSVPEYEAIMNRFKPNEALSRPKATENIAVPGQIYSYGELLDYLQPRPDIGAVAKAAAANADFALAAPLVLHQESQPEGKLN